MINRNFFAAGSDCFAARHHLFQPRIARIFTDGALLNLSRARIAPVLAQLGATYCNLALFCDRNDPELRAALECHSSATDSERVQSLKFKVQSLNFRAQRIRDAAPKIFGARLQLYLPQSRDQPLPWPAIAHFNERVFPSSERRAGHKAQAGSKCCILQLSGQGIYSGVERGRWSSIGSRPATAILSAVAPRCR